MPRVKKGELSLGEIRNLVRQHNKVSVIKGVDSKTRAALLKEISDMGYRVDHEKKKIIRGSAVLSVGKEGEQKQQKKTKRKALISGGDKPVLATSKTVKTKAAAEKKARIAKLDQMVKKYPDIPPNIKGKKIKATTEKQKALMKARREKAAERKKKSGYKKK